MRDQGPTAGDAPLRLNFLDGVRGCAALYVVLHHVWLTQWPDYPDGGAPWFLGWLGYGQLAVAVFIVVSGFSLTIGPARRGMALTGGWRTFLRRRAWRILPPYWAALGVSAAVFGWLTPDLTGHVITPGSMLVHGALLQDVIDTPKPNGAFWSIALEWQIYFLFPAVLLLRRRWSGVAVAVLATAGVVLVQVGAWLSPPLQRVENLTPQFFALFVMGVAAAGVLSGPSPHRGHRRLLRWGGGGLLAGFVTVAAVQGLSWVDARYFWVDLFVGAAVAMVLAGFCDHGALPVRDWFAGPVPAGLGRFSYSVYLIHLPLLWVVGHFVVDPWVVAPLDRFGLLLALGVPTVLVGSYAFHRVFERPFSTHRSVRALRAARHRTVPRVAEVPG